jgi:predicted NBD/HSP70 family sugar kinase
MNDVQAALSEEFHDAEPGVIGGVIMVGSAIGAAFQVADVPLLGARGWAGELGYLPLWMDGTVKRLDEVAGGVFMAGQLGTDGEGLAALATDGDKRAIAVIALGGLALGLGIASVIHLLNPSKLALGGGTLALPGYKEAAYAAAKQFSLPEHWVSCELSTVRLCERVVALGAIRLASVRSGS